LPPSNGEFTSRAPAERGIRRALTIGAGDVEGRASMAGIDPAERRPSIAQVQQRVISFVKDSKANCDEGGPCYGFSDPCGLECSKHLGLWPGPSRASTAVRKGSEGIAARSHHHTHGSQAPSESRGECLHEDPSWTSQAQSSETEVGDDDGQSTYPHSRDLEAQSHQHHHHVHNNAFLSLGLQTCIAITLHKFPEGFITYATNHANPVLGFNVFTALFVHNITEGFALALPLYMALGSRLRAMFWASLLGGLSQPAGAGIAALWFHLARRTQMRLNETVYACLFSVTAGIMVSVALELFVESLSLNHNRNLSIFCAFMGMVVLGLSNAFVSGL
jgi:ZIP family zinc transporter